MRCVFKFYCTTLYDSNSMNKNNPIYTDSNLLKNFSAYYVQRSMLDIGISKKYRDLSSRSL